MDLSVIIVSWNVRDKLRENLVALTDSSHEVSFEIFVVDNASHDGSAEMVKSDFPEVKLIANGENLGFAKANNQAIRLAGGAFVLLLNPDMKVGVTTLSQAVEWMKKNPQAWVSGCKLVTADGQMVRHVRKFPTVWDQLAIILKLPHLFPSILNKYLQVGFDYSRAARVDSVRGSFFIIRRDTLKKIGMLDERFFVWFEEVDFCRRIGNAGGEVWYTPVAECTDYVGQSFKLLKRGLSQRYFRDSMLKYFKKWHPVWQYWLLRLCWPLGLSFAFLLEKIGYQGKAKT